MFERFTEPARQVLVLAQEEARTLKHDYIGTEHILLGLLREEETLAARILGSLEITAERVRAQVVRIVGSGEEASSGQIPFTPGAKGMLERALRETVGLKHDYIGTEHILLGLVGENDGVAARILLESGADLDNIRNVLVAVLPPSRRRPSGGRGGEGKRPAARKSPEELLEQRRTALERANEIRSARARLKRGVKEGSMEPAGVILDPPPEVQTAKVYELLLAVPGWGRVVANRALNHARISPFKAVGALTERQRHDLVNLLGPPRQGSSGEP